MINLSDSAWSYYEQAIVIASLLISIVIVAVAFRTSKLTLKTSFIVGLAWDFSHSWASNISGLAGVVGISVASSIAPDFKLFTHATIKNSYTVNTVLMAAIVIAAPSVYTMLQVRKNNQLVGCVGGFLAASVLTIWGTIAQLLLQIAMLLSFVNENVGNRFGLVLVPAVLFLGLVILIPYSIRSIRVNLAAETQRPAAPAISQPIAGAVGTLRAQLESEAESTPIVSEVPPRKVALL